MDEDWRESNSALRPLRQRLQYIFEKELYTDILFKIGPTEERFKAHTLIVTVQSQEFERMLTNRWDELEMDEETGLKIYKIDHVSPKVFKQIMKFFYTDTFYEGTITVQDVFEAYSFAVAYDSTSLINLCMATVKGLIKDETCIEILNWSYFLPHDLKDIVFEPALKFIAENIYQMVYTIDFLSLDVGPLTEILKYDKMNIKETVLFNALDRWSNTIKHFKDEDARERTDRHVVAKYLAKSIRFLLMTSEEFVKEVMPTKILKDYKANEILSCINGTGKRIKEYEYMSKPRKADEILTPARLRISSARKSSVIDLLIMEINDSRSKQD